MTAVTEAEIRTGIALLPEGKRRRGLARACERAFDSLFAGRVLPFDRDAARADAEIVAARRAIGRPVAHVDGQIAAIARSRGMAVAMRNIRDFEFMGIDVFNPWDRASVEQPKLSLTTKATPCRGLNGRIRPDRRRQGGHSSP